jgi:hypothetical protein
MHVIGVHLTGTLAPHLVMFLLPTFYGQPFSVPLSLHNIYLTDVYVIWACISQGVHLRGVYLMGGRISQGVRILWASASYGRVYLVSVYLMGVSIISHVGIASRPLWRKVTQLPPLLATAAKAIHASLKPDTRNSQLPRCGVRNNLLPACRGG